MKVKQIKKEGFTLIELVLAVSIAAVLLSAIAGICFPVKQSIKGTQDRFWVDGRLEILFGRLEKDLSFAVKPYGIEENLFVGRADQIQFYTADPLRFTGEDPVPGPAKVSVRFDSRYGWIERLEKSLFQKNRPAEPLVIGKDFEQVRFQFLGRQGWVSSWEGTAWPRVVQITGVIESPLGKKVSFEKTFYPQSR